MKILSLKALNINSLKGKTEINFSEFLKESSLFAITGATGSGKSTLLDIISCALYAKTARLKNPNNLMSRHTGEAFCEVEFEIKGKLYRSSWSQKRARKKHDGKFQSAKMELSDVNNNTILETGLIEVPKRIEKLSGLDFGRFTQSMMLAQGGFDAFLKADEKERSALLEKITGTQIYAEISKAVHVKYSEYQKEIEIESASLDSITLLDDKIVEEKSQKLILQKAKKLKLEKAFKASSIALTWVKTLASLKDDFQKYQQEFRRISKEKEENKETFEKLKLAEKALHVNIIYNEKKSLEESLHGSNASAVSLQKELAKLNKDIAQKSQSYMRISQSTQEAEKKFELENEKLKKARTLQVQEKEIEKNISTLQALLKTQKSKEKKLGLHVEKLNENFKNFEKQISDKKKYLQDNITDEKLLSDLSAIEQILKQFHTENSNNKIAKSNVKTIQEKLIVQKNTLQSIQAEIEILKLTCKTKEQEILLQKYAQERAKLKEGEPCFLCGATSHPYVHNSPDISSDNTQYLINELQNKIDLKQKKEDELYTLRIENSSMQAKQEQFEFTLRASLEKLDTLMQNLKSYSANFSVENLDTHYKILLGRKKAYIDAQKNIQDIEKKSFTCKLDKKESETQLLSLKEELLEDTQKLHELEERLENLKKERITILNIADLQSFEKEINHRYKLAQKTQQEAKSELEILQTKSQEQSKQEKSLLSKITKDEKQLKDLSQKLQDQLQESNFKSEKELEDAIVSPDMYESLSLTCKRIDKQYAQINTLKIEIEKRLETHQKESKTDKSIAKLEKELQAIQEEADSLQLYIGSDEKELELNLKNEMKYKEKIAFLQKKKDSFKVWMKLQELIGSADGTKFKKFAQGVTLDQLIHLANTHLSNLSERYSLVRSSEEKQLLELEVIDAFQGNVSRSVNTLSGGESFIVSLALALGLSSLASQKIAIDSLFLDEGFGTLDTQSLEMALNALNLLQSSGKMLGIISHVEALKERIPLQIKVISNGDGTSYIEL